MVKNLRAAPLRAALACCAFAAALASCGDKALFVKPARSAGTAAALQTQDSTLGARVSIPLDTIRTSIDNALPRTLSGAIGPEAPPCARVSQALKIISHCVAVDADYAISRGTVAVAASGARSFRVSAPVSIGGHGNLRAGNALDRFVIDALSLGTRSFDGAAVVTADISLDVGADWCPKPAVKLDLQWTSGPRFQALGGVWIDLGPILRGRLAPAAQAIEESIVRAVPCDAARSQAGQLMAARSVPIRLPLVGQTFVNVRPTGAGYSGLNVTADAVSMAFRVSAKADLGPEAAAAAPTALPPLQAIPDVAPRIRIAVPVRPTYGQLTDAANELLAGRTFAVDTPAGKASVAVHAVEVYPAGDRVAVGVDLAIDMPGSLFDVEGSLYALGAPRIDGTVLTLDDVGFAQVLDDDAWGHVTAPLRQWILSEIVRATRYDAAQDAAALQQTLADALTRLGAAHGLQLRPIAPRIGLSRVAVAADSLQIEGLFEATLDAALAAPGR
ncbi:MAG: DUF4403 family protein [Burkholderiaceae bacterium]